MAPRMLLVLLLACGASSQEDTGRILDSIEKLTRFFSRKQVIASQLADGVYGLRVAQGVLATIQQKDIATPTKGRASKLLEAVRHAADASEVAAEGNNPRYSAAFAPMVHEAVPVSEVQWADLDPDQQGSERQVAAFEEQSSDMCLSAIWDKSKRCVVSPACWRMMSQPLRQGYTLTHQVLFMTLIKRFGCQSKVESAHTARIQDLIQAKCAAMLTQLRQESATGQLGSDLAIEQIYACGVNGFSQFLQGSQLSGILSQQEPSSGCFQASAGRRRLLFDREVQGCSLHKSSVALCALATFLQKAVDGG